MFKIKRTKCDALFSELLRDEADYECERCFRQFERKDRRLHLSHFWSRGNKSVRFDRDNVCVLCFSCHQRFTQNPAEHSEFFLRRLGQRRYDVLGVRARTPAKIDEKMLAIIFEKELKKLKEGRKAFKDYK